MEKESLKEIYERIVPPKFTDEMIEKILNNYSSRFLYNSIQHINGLDTSQSTQISKEDEDLIKKKLGDPQYMQTCFNHFKSSDFVTNVDNRLYINCPKQVIAAFVTNFADKCKEKELPYYFKYCTNAEYGLTRRTDQVVIYSNIVNTEEYVQILREMEKENPDLVSSFGKPPALTGTIDGWIGFGEEPTRNQRKMLGKKDVSYTSLRTEIISRLFRSQNFDNYDIARQAILAEFERFDILPENSTISKSMAMVYENENGIMNKFIELYDKQIEVARKEKEQDREFLILGSINNLSTAGLLSTDLEKSLRDMTQTRKGFFSDIIPRGGFYIKKEEFGLDELSDDELYSTVTGFLKDRVLDDISIIEQLKSRYIELSEVDAMSDFEMAKEKTDLYTRLVMVANSQKFLKEVGVQEDYFLESCEQTQKFLDDFHRNDPEALQEVSHRTAKEILETVLEEISSGSELMLTATQVEEMIQNLGITNNDLTQEVELLELVKKLRSYENIISNENISQVNDEPSL